MVTFKDFFDACWILREALTDTDLARAIYVAMDQPGQEGERFTKAIKDSQLNPQIIDALKIASASAQPGETDPERLKRLVAAAFDTVKIPFYGRMSQLDQAAVLPPRPAVGATVSQPGRLGARLGGHTFGQAAQRIAGSTTDIKIGRQDHLANKNTYSWPRAGDAMHVGFEWFPSKSLPGGGVWKAPPGYEFGRP